MEHRQPEDDFRRRLIAGLTFEVVPTKSLDRAIEALPPASEVSVTCSPVKGIDETIRVTDRLRTQGHTAIPHIAARMVRDPADTARIARWLRSEHIGRMFLVGGDADPPNHYHDATTFLRDLLDADPDLHTVGVTAYPDGHAFIDDQTLSAALHDKQVVLTEAGISGYASTQMCFDPDAIVDWLRRERAANLTLPIHLGIAGVVDRGKLMTMGTRLGIGASLGFLRKNRKAVGQLLTRADYNPDVLLRPLSPHLEELGITGIHCFTFNQIAATVDWRRSQIA